MLTHLENVGLKVAGFTFDIAPTGSEKLHKLKLALEWIGEADDAGKVFAFATTVAKDRVRISLRESATTPVLVHGVARLGNVTYAPGPMDKPRKLKIPVEVVTDDIDDVSEWFDALLSIVADHLSIGAWSLKWAEEELAREDAEREARKKDAPGQTRIEDVDAA